MTAFAIVAEVPTKSETVIAEVSVLQMLIPCTMVVVEAGTV